MNEIHMERGNTNLKINNSKSAMRKGKWKDPGAKLYMELLGSLYHHSDQVDDTKNLDYQQYLKEAYLIAPTKDINNSPHRTTPFVRSGCKYPHHVIKDDQLVLHLDGLKWAYTQAWKNKELDKGTRAHLNRHLKECNLKLEHHHGQIYLSESGWWDEKIEEDFEDIEEYLELVEVEEDVCEEETLRSHTYDPIIESNFQDIQTFLELQEGDYDKSETNKKKIKSDGRFPAPTIEPEIDERDFHPIYVILKCSLSTSPFGRAINRITGARYQHALISLDDSFRHMYSYFDKGLEHVDIKTHPRYQVTDDMMVQVLFLLPDDKEKIRRALKMLEDHQDDTSYANENLIKLILPGVKVSSVDKRFVCSTIVGYLLSIANRQNTHKDFSLMKPEDLTVLPRCFYVMNFKDAKDFSLKRRRMQQLVNKIYNNHYDEINEYNNILPRILLKRQFRKFGFTDQLIDYIFRWRERRGNVGI